MATTTPILGLSKPVVGADDDVWGGMLNGNMDILDGLVRPVDLNAYLKLAGGTMQGPMALAGNAVLAMQPVPLQQLTSVTGNYVAKAGDTMTGPLVLNGNAAAALNPVPLQQLNTAIGAYLPLVGGIMLGDIVLKGNAAAALNPVPLQQLTTSLAPYLLKSGGAMTGVLTLAADATTGLQATTYQQLTAGLGTKIGDAPADSAYYARRNNAWAVAPGSAITTDAPSDSFAYGRLNAAWSKVLPLAGGVVAGATTINGNVFAATTGHVTAPGRTVVPADAVGTWWQPMEMALGFNSGHIAFNAYIGNPGSPVWKALTAGYAATMYLAAGGNFNLTVLPSAAAGATFGSTVGSFDFRNDGSFVANGWITSGTGITAGSGLYVNTSLFINPANSWEWSFYRDGSGNHIQNHRANWYDIWQSTDGNRIWYGPAGALMSVNGGGTVTAYGYLYCVGSGRVDGSWQSNGFTSINGRIISKANAYASVSMYDTATGLAMGWYVDNNLCFGTMDANGGVVTYLGSFNTTGTLATVGAVTASQQVISYGQRVISQGTGEPSFCMHRPGYYAAGFLLNASNQIVVANMDGNGGWQSTLAQFNSDGTFSATLDVVCGRNFSTGGGMFCGTLVASGYTYAGGHFVGGNGDTNTGLYRTGGQYILQFSGSWYWGWQTNGGQLNWTCPGASIIGMRTTDWLMWNQTGTVGGIGAYQNYSDRRGKRDIEPTEVGLPEVLKLQPVRFTRIWKPELITGRKFPDGRDMPDFIPRSEIGFVAQDAREALPEAVVEVADFVDGEARFCMTLDPIVAALVNAVKTLNARLTALEA